MEIDRNEMGSEGNVVKSVKLKTGDGIELCDILEWLLVEVFIRLPVKFVFRSKLVSKQWLSLISEPSFVRMYVSRASMLPKLQPWTFIADNMHVEDSRSSGFCDQKFLVDIHSSGLFKHPGLFVLSCPCTEHPHGTRYKIVGVSNGLVLYGSRLPKELRLHDFHRYSICNPITGQWITLPPHAHHFMIVSSGFLTRVENNILTSYRVVRLGLPLQRGKTIRFEVLLPEIGEWKDFTVCIDQEIEVTFQRAPTALNGILHWVTRKHGIIAYDPYHKPDYLRFIALPSDVDLKCNNEPYNGIPRLLDVHQGRLRYFESTMNPQGFSGFGVWLLNDYSTRDWCLQHRISYADILHHDILSGKHLYLLPISFHPFDSDIVYLGSKEIIVSCNMNTRKFDDHGGSLDVGDIIVQARSIANRKNWPRWWSTFLLMIPPWPIYIFPCPLL